MVVPSLKDYVPPIPISFLLDEMRRMDAFLARRRKKHFRLVGRAAKSCLTPGGETDETASRIRFMMIAPIKKHRRAKGVKRGGVRLRLQSNIRTESSLAQILIDGGVLRHPL
jgi:hypothetical protein